MGGLYDGTGPEVTVEIATAYTRGFVIGSSLIGGTDTLGRGEPTWTALPCEDLISVGIRRGRSREDQAVQPGTLTVVVDNYGGDYDPDNPGSPYYYAGRTLLTRGLRGRVRATWAGVDYVLFEGWIEQVDADMSRAPRVTLTFADALAWLGAQELPVQVGGGTGEATATRVGRVLDLAGWPATARSLTGSRLMRTTTLGKSALALCDEADACEYGRLFATRDGTVRLSPYEGRFSTPLRLTLSDTASGDAVVWYDSIRTAPGARYIANSVRVEQDSGAWQDYTVQASVDAYGVQDRTHRAPLYSDSEAATLAQIIGDRLAWPVTRVERVEWEAVGMASGAWPGLLACDLGDNAMIERTNIDGRAHSWTSLVESINHDITATSWRVSVDLSPSTRAGIFTIGSSLIGGPDLLWY